MLRNSNRMQDLIEDSNKKKELEKLKKQQQEEQERKEREAAILRHKYSNLYSQLNTIKLKLIDLNSYYQIMVSDMKENIIIDKETVEENTLKTLIDDNNKVLQELTNTTMTRVRSNF